MDFITGLIKEARVDKDHPFLARLIHSARLRVVRRSSSMMPILRVLGFNPRISSTRPNTSTAKLTSSGPCISA